MVEYNVTIFGLELTLKPVAFSIPLGKNHWDIYWYGIIIATGFLLALIYGMKNAKRFDINVDRFADYMKRSDFNTQFICVTHRRGTMEAADMLYGVTMQEKGVTKLLELNVAELEKKLLENQGA